MGAEFARELGDKFGAFDGGGVDGDFVGSRLDDGVSVVERSDAASCREGNGKFGGDAANGFEKRGATVARSGDIEDDEFVSAFRVVAGGELGGITGVAEANEVDAFDDASAVGIEAGNDAAGEGHDLAGLAAATFKKFCRRREPAAPLFSGWNCVA